MSEIQNAIEVKNLKKGFGGRVLFENFSLNVKANTIHAIIGPNGSGKTTLLRLITGVYQPNAGTINIAGKYAMELENDYLYEEQTGLENLKIFGKYFGFEINDRSDSYCTQLGLTEHLGKRVSTYSNANCKCKLDTCTVELSESERRSGWKPLASVLGDAAAAFGCVNRVEELVKQFLRGAVAKLLARPSVQFISCSQDILSRESLNGHALRNKGSKQPVVAFVLGTFP